MTKRTGPDRDRVIRLLHPLTITPKLGDKRLGYSAGYFLQFSNNTFNPVRAPKGEEIDNGDKYKYRASVGKKSHNGGVIIADCPFYSCTSTNIARYNMIAVPPKSYEAPHPRRALYHYCP